MPTNETPSIEITRVDPAAVDLDLADHLAELGQASLAAAGLSLPPPTGPSLVTSLQHGNNGRAVDALWVAGPLNAPVGWGVVSLPFLDNLAMAGISAVVAPDRRRSGWGSHLLDRQLGFAREHGRTSVSTGAWDGSDGGSFLGAREFTTAGQLRNAVRRLDLHGDTGRFDRLLDEAAGVAGDYELVHIRGRHPTRWCRAWSPPTRPSMTPPPTRARNPMCGTRRGS